MKICNKNCDKACTNLELRKKKSRDYTQQIMPTNRINQHHCRILLLLLLLLLFHTPGDPNTV
jgi:hypothetical protein